MAALRAAVFSLFAKNLGGRRLDAPPGPARVKIKVMRKVKVRSKVKKKTLFAHFGL